MTLKPVRKSCLEFKNSVSGSQRGGLIRDRSRKCDYKLGQLTVGAPRTVVGYSRRTKVFKQHWEAGLKRR